MANLITTALTYSKEDVSKFFLSPLFVGDNGMMNFDVMTGVKSSFKLQKFSSISKVTKAFGSGFTGATGSTLSQRSISVARTKAEVEQEANSFYNTIVGEWLALGNAKDNFEAAEQLKEIVSGIMMKGVSRDLARQLYFGDTASLSADYNIYDGIFKNYASLPAPQKLVFPAGAIAVDGAIAQMQACIDAAPAELRELKGEALFEVSGTVADNYRASLRSTGTEMADNVLRKGEEMLSYDGINIKVHREWDTHIAADALATDKHRIILHVPKNVVVGTDFEENAGAEMWYNADLIVNRFRMTYVIGTNYKNDELAVTNIAV